MKYFSYFIWQPSICSLSLSHILPPIIKSSFTFNFFNNFLIRSVHIVTLLVSSCRTHIALLPWYFTVASNYVLTKFWSLPNCLSLNSSFFCRLVYIVKIYSTHAPTQSRGLYYLLNCLGPTFPFFMYGRDENCPAGGRTHSSRPLSWDVIRRLPLFSVHVGEKEFIPTCRYRENVGRWCTHLWVNADPSC